MKKALTSMFVASLAFGAVSCSKDYYCECTALANITTQATIHPIGYANKSEATDACAALEASHKSFDAQATCELW